MGDLDDALAAFQRGSLAEARRIVERQRDAGGGTPFGEHLLGLIHCRSGRIDEGVDCLQRAADAEPGNAAFRLMLERALVDCGRAADVLAMPEPPADGQAESLALWHSRAQAADALERWPEAVTAWRACIEARANDWRAWRRFGVALGGTGQWAAAAAALERCVELQPNDAEARFRLGEMLEKAGRGREGLDHFDEAVRLVIGQSGLTGGDVRADSLMIDPSKPKAVRWLGLLLERASRIDELRTLLELAFAAGVDPADVGYLAAAVALGDGEPDEARRLLLADRKVEDAGRWHSLLVKIEDARGDSAAAFAAAEAMNRAVPNHDEWQTKGASYRARLRSVAAALNRDWAGRISPIGRGERKSPAFIVGFPRSGTTLLDTFLMGHPDAQVVEEQPLVSAAELAIGGMLRLPECSAADLERARDAYFAELDRHVDPGFAGRVIDKVPLNMIAVPLICTLFPDAPIIFAQRHPCDVVLSCFMRDFMMNEPTACFLDLADSADLYDAAMDLFTRGRELWPGRVRSVVYEDLVADPEAVLRPMTDELGLTWTGELLDHQSTARRRRSIGTPGYNQVVQPLNRRAVGRWRRYEKQLEPVLPVLLPWAERLEYAD